MTLLHPSFLSAGPEMTLLQLTLTFAFVLALGNPLVLAQEKEELVNSIGMKLVRIPAGKFLRGSPVDEVGSQDDESQHEVTLTREYYIGVFEVTQAEYETIMRENPSYFPEAVIHPAVRHPETGRLITPERKERTDGSRYPVDRVSWDDAVRFCEKLSSRREEVKRSRVYRLPTEAEWEYACRAGSKTAFSFGGEASNLSQFGWYSENSNQSTHPVGEKQPNAWGLYDMHGNVSEWCLDYHLNYPQENLIDPAGPANGRRRVCRGGNWSELTAANCRSAHREGLASGVKLRAVGLRVVMTIEK
jgi:formylglycine-generating enzyme required for sulfatase activity